MIGMAIIRFFLGEITPMEIWTECSPLFAIQI